MSEQTAREAGGPRFSPRLIGVNAALLGALAVATILTSRGADAQPGSGAATSTPPVRSRGEYTVVSGRYQGGTSNAIWILDAANQELLALAWDRSRDEMEVIGHRRLADDAQIKTGR